MLKRKTVNFPELYLLYINEAPGSEAAGAGKGKSCRKKLLKAPDTAGGIRGVGEAVEGVRECSEVG